MSDQDKGAARVRISLTTGEFEVEGSETFISQYQESIGSVLELLLEKGPSGPAPTAPTTSVVPALPAPSAQAGAEEPFGEVLHSLSSKSGTDQILLAGHYVGKGREDGTFSTIEAHQLLMGQGVKLSNASQSMKNNLNAKRVFKVGKGFKVAKQGSDHLKSLGVSAA